MWRKLMSLMRDGEPEGEPSLRRKCMSLQPTMRGRSLAAAGKVELREDAEWQCVVLAVRANLSDGTPLAVLLNHLPAGWIRMNGQEAEFELAVSDSEALPGGLPAVSCIQSVMVATQDGTAVLTARVPE